MGGLSCSHCGTSNTPCWRKGPEDRRLCNACGSRWLTKGTLVGYMPGARTTRQPGQAAKRQRISEETGSATSLCQLPSSSSDSSEISRSIYSGVWNNTGDQQAFVQTFGFSQIMQRSGSALPQPTVFSSSLAAAAVALRAQQTLAASPFKALAASAQPHPSVSDEGAAQACPEATPSVSSYPFSGMPFTGLLAMPVSAFAPNFGGPTAPLRILKIHQPSTSMRFPRVPPHASARAPCLTPVSCNAVTKAQQACAAPWPLPTVRAPAGVSKVTHPRPHAQGHTSMVTRPTAAEQIAVASLLNAHQHPMRPQGHSLSGPELLFAAAAMCTLPTLCTLPKAGSIRARPRKQARPVATC
mmetsp:Transcript_18629/g.31760  ORF Transcript_18629/g.31760 Transcript_18629/m.31760 type:complete len:355 (+) Transcript_18629:81-1145(+)|eukprot:CAMPEP_0119103266 /NCGR_PEP_ID=MMETSP1180-20130426/1740_1 /TAXON_ID=3052 ORGANISM="Chlamydomonas cf sp, Strain CCMP681" /NCGR_SAMPLE_ID=MMETSP1180 /ASSEMBLY_ACC=CAM_ASM_000741 /LENGTH=354 /DNA_ID=CAMNT_0007087721 /DNA_START=72 /DNA_END=1136 /DNA_ORIENTATION=-